VVCYPSQACLTNCYLSASVGTSLTVIHHQQNHATGNERSWWQEHKIETTH